MAKRIKPQNNLSFLAESIAYYEGGKTAISIAQIKEVLTLLGHVLKNEYTVEDSMMIVARLIQKGK